MKAGITFSSGNPVRAEDAAYSLQRAVKLNKTPAFILNQFGWTAETVDSMISGAGDTLTIKVDKPYAPTFLYNCLTAGVASIVDAETVKTHEVVTDGVSDMGNEWLKTNSAGTGAYILKSFKANEGYVLEARPGYWRGDAKIAKIFMQHVPEAATERLQLEKGDVDIARSMTPTDVAGLEGNADVAIQSDVGGQVYYLSFNQKNENYKNAKFLDAMRWAIDYQGMADTIMKGAVIPHQAFLPQGYLGALDDLPYSLDIEKAKALLAESGITDPKVTLSVRNSADRMDVAQSIQNTFGQAGITVELKTGEGAEQLKEYRARLHDATLQTWGPDYPDPNTNSSTFAENPDILRDLSASPRRPRLVVGFAAETDHVLDHAAAKLARKGCDWIVANDVSPATGTFGGERNTVHLITEAGTEDWPPLGKGDVAMRLAGRISLHLAEATKKQAAE